VIKYSKFISIIKYEDILLLKNDIETLKYNYRIGLDTLLVYTIKYEYTDFSEINVINTPPGQYSRKVET